LDHRSERPTPIATDRLLSDRVEFVTEEDLDTGVSAVQLLCWNTLTHSL
jgi:hypothetical protein